SLLFLCACSALHRALLSFPTRRSSDLQRSPRREQCSRNAAVAVFGANVHEARPLQSAHHLARLERRKPTGHAAGTRTVTSRTGVDRKSTRLNSSHGSISYAVFCLKKKK